MKLNTLYKKTSTGADQEWTISTEDNVIVTRWGQVGGKIQEGRDTVTEGKNAGRANATTPTQQAEAEAKSQWEKKLKKGYVQDLDDARAGKTDDVIEGGVFPMLAHKFNEQGHKIKYPAYVQPKFDGHRCIAVVKDGQATLWSRTRKPITGLPHINKAIENLVKSKGVTDVVLDGELYHHDYRNNFEDLTSFIRNPVPKPGHEIVQFHVYDTVSELTFDNRASTLSALNMGGVLRHVPTEIVNCEDELMEAFDKLLSQGYEGAMVRNKDGLYVNKRSADLQKVKEFDDSEFVVIAVEEGRGKLTGHAVFVCKTEDGTEFRTKMAGDTAALKQFWEHPELVVGKMVTVKYQGLTNKNGVPRFPVAVRIRED